MAYPQILNSFLKDLGLNTGGGGGGNKKQKVRYDFRGRPIKPIPPNPYTASVPVAPGGGSSASDAARISKYLQDASDRGWAKAHGYDPWSKTTALQRSRRGKAPKPPAPVVPKKKAPPKPKAPKIEITQEDGFGQIPPRHAATTARHRPLVETHQNQRKPLSAARSGTGV